MIIDKNNKNIHGGGYGIPMTMQIRSGCEGGGKGALIQENKSATLSTHNTQTLFDPVKTVSVDQRNQTTSDEKAETLHGVGHGSSVATIMQPIPIADKATRYKGGGDTRNNDGSANGLGVGEPGAPANTLTAADRHAVAYAMQAFGKYEESEIASTIKARDCKSGTDLVVEWEYIIRRLTPLECCRLQGFPDNWTEDIAIKNPSASTIREWMIAWAEWWRLIGRDDGIQLPKDAKAVERWLADPASDSGLYKMWGNGIALPCAMFVMEGISMVLEQENKEEQEDG